LASWQTTFQRRAVFSARRWVFWGERKNVLARCILKPRYAAKHSGGTPQKPVVFLFVLWYNKEEGRQMAMTNEEKYEYWLEYAAYDLDTARQSYYKKRREHSNGCNP
jgi:hypothetical protein